MDDSLRNSLNNPIQGKDAAGTLSNSSSYGVLKVSIPAGQRKF